jgi:hypothetical protein
MAKRTGFLFFEAIVRQKPFVPHNPPGNIIGAPNNECAIGG